jgi:hypothetical protein
MIGCTKPIILDAAHWPSKIASHCGRAGVVGRRKARRKTQPWTSAAARRIQEVAGTSDSVEDAVRVVATRTMSGIHCPPTDLDALATRLGITSVRSEDLPVSAELRRVNDGYEVVYSLHQPPTRRRFSIAHELAHVIFESTGPNPPRTGQELERLCDMIATEFLLPRDRFMEIAGPEPSLQQVFQLARLFEASLSTTAIRCCELGPGVSFEVEGQRVVWAKGANKGVAGEIDAAVNEAIRGNWVNTEVLRFDRGVGRMWRVEGAPLGQGGRAIFLLRPIHSLSLIKDT